MSCLALEIADSQRQNWTEKSTRAEGCKPSTGDTGSYIYIQNKEGHDECVCSASRDAG